MRANRDGTFRWRFWEDFLISFHGLLNRSLMGSFDVRGLMTQKGQTGLPVQRMILPGVALRHGQP